MNLFWGGYTNQRDADLMWNYDQAQGHGRQSFTLMLADGSRLQLYAEGLTVGPTGELIVWSRSYQVKYWDNTRDTRSTDYDAGPQGDAYPTLVIAAGRWVAWSLGEHGWETTCVIWHSEWERHYDDDNGAVKKPKKNGSGRRPISWATRQWIKERDEFRCKMCNTHENLTVDHIVSVAEGGTNDVSNLQTLCQSCNSRKGAKSQ